MVSENIRESNINPENMNTTNCKSNQPSKMSHKEWKKFKRKQKRQAEAKCKVTECVDSPEKSESSDPEEKKKEEQQNLYNHRLFLEREKLAQQMFLAKKERERREKEYLEEQQRQIKEEWEELKKKDEEEREKKEKRMKTEKERQDALLKEATQHENKDAWHNPIAPVVYNSERPVNECPFFKKTGTCKYGDGCSRTHDYPEESTTILLPGMFTHFRLDQSLIDEYDTDLSLEYEDKDIYKSFLEFYHDVLPEFKAIGRVTQFKVCSNCSPHVRGNVYVSYEKIEDAAQAVMKFNGRWYAGRQISCEYRHIEKWKSAICGLFAHKVCPKGNICNFLHVFKNPNNEFRDADFDFQYNNYHSDRRERDSYRGHRSRSRDRSSYRDRSRERSKRNHRSRSRDYSRYKRSRSRSKDRSQHRGSRSREVSRRSKRSRSKDRSHYKKRPRDRSIDSRTHNGKSRRRRSRSYSSSKSRSASKERVLSRYSNKRSRSNSNSVSPSRDRSRSPFKSKKHRMSRSSSRSDSDNERQKRKKHKKKSKKSKKSKSAKNKDHSLSPETIVKKINKIYGNVNLDHLDAVITEDLSTFTN